MIRKMKAFLIPITLLVLLIIAACGSSRDSADGKFVAGQAAVEEFAIGAPMATPAPMAASAAPAIEPAFALEQSVMAAAAPVAAPEAQFADDEDAGLDVEVALVSQQRIIVRTVDMELEVTDVLSAIDDVAVLAQEQGGWVVSSDRSQRQHGFISIRVPAELLDDIILQLRDMAVEVESEFTTSRDVTDEYVDNTARLRNLEVTQEALISLLDREGDIEDLLAVQRELTRIQGEMERIQGRISFLEETAAFSLVNVGLRLAPIEIVVDAGPNQTFSVGELARFQASFEVPEDMEDFTFTWDFGDGSEPVFGRRTVQSLDEGIRVTATVTHTYFEDRNSPYIVEVKIFGNSDVGAADGEDTFIATVTKLPTIEVFAGDSRIAEEGEDGKFEASFTRPAGLSELSAQWEFGDGTVPAISSLEDGVTNASATHRYSDHRPIAYTATLTITGLSDAGDVEGSDTISVLVTESRGWAIGGWSARDTAKTAVRALSAVGIGLAYFFVVAAILSPVWIIGGVGGFFLIRRARRRRAESGGRS